MNFLFEEKRNESRAAQICKENNNPMKTKPWITSFCCVFENKRKKIRSSSTTSVVWISWNKSILQGEENLKGKKNQANKQINKQEPTNQAVK